MVEGLVSLEVGLLVVVKYCVQSRNVRNDGRIEMSYWQYS
jgi:hypothetical protein